MLDRKSAERALRYLREFIRKQQTRVAALSTLLGEKVEGEDGVAAVEAWRVGLTTETINGDPSHPLNAKKPRHAKKAPLPAHPANLDLLTGPATLALKEAEVPVEVIEAAVKACKAACRRLGDEFNRLEGMVPRDRGRLVKLNKRFEKANDRLGRVQEYLRHPDRSRVVPFVPTPLQKEILMALDGKALTQSKLEEATKTDRAQLQRKNGLKGLISSGRVVHGGRGVGYFRPDAPPPSAMSP
jgi:hypothetical protein